MDTQYTCAWCEPGTPGNHGICEKHKAQLLAEYNLNEQLAIMKAKASMSFQDHLRQARAKDVAKTFSDLERARAYRYPQPMRNDVLEAAWNAPEPTVWSALKWVGFGVLCGLAGVLMVLAMAWEGLP